MRWAVEVSSKIFDCVDVMAYGIFRKVTTLEFFQHHFAKSGHGDGLLMTRQLISTFRQLPLHYLTRSVRRTSGFVLADNLGAISPGDFADTPLARMARFSAKWMAIRYWHETLGCLLTRTVVHKLIRRRHRRQRLPTRQ